MRPGVTLRPRLCAVELGPGAFAFRVLPPGLCPSGELCGGLLGEETRNTLLGSVESACVSGWASRRAWVAVATPADSRSPHVPSAFPERPTLPCSAQLSLGLSAPCSRSGVGVGTPGLGGGVGRPGVLARVLALL